MKTYIALLPGLIALIYTIFRSPEKAFLNIYLPVLLLLPQVFVAKIKGLLDLLLLPLAYHTLLLLALLTYAPTQIYAAAALGIVFTHIVAGIFIGGGSWKDYLALLATPFYVAWKLFVLLRIVLTMRPNARWVRTGREGSDV